MSTLLEVTPFRVHHHWIHGLPLTLPPTMGKQQGTGGLLGSSVLSWQDPIVNRPNDITPEISVYKWSLLTYSSARWSSNTRVDHTCTPVSIICGRQEWPQAVNISQQQTEQSLLSTLVFLQQFQSSLWVLNTYQDNVGSLHIQPPAVRKRLRGTQCPI